MAKRKVNELQQDFSVARQWFSDKGWAPFPFQEDVWRAYLEEKNGLLNAPTGSGKTYALWFPCLLEWIRNNPDDWQGKRPGSLQVLWITPLRALARDLQQAMQQVCDDIGLPWTVALRTGDTSSAERQRQLKKTPECIITTPESLHLLLSQKDSSRLFRNFRALIIDEWHELLGTKRGVQVELAISRLQQINKQQPKIWAVSATIGNLEQAIEVLLGQKGAREAAIIKAAIDKKIEIASILPEEVEKFPWAGYLGIKLLPKILPIVENSQSTLLFTNTRSQTEIWYQQLMAQAPELAGLVAMHHGSLDREVRDWVENGLHEGKLKLVICTSSLDLGVDFKPVETVIQVGSPKGVARFMQRAGRSGHQPGAISRIYFLPTHSLELVEAAALKKALKEEVYESRPPLEKCIDVLLQYMVTLAIGEGFDEKSLFEAVKNTYCYRHLSREEWEWALDFITTGGGSLQEYEEFNKVDLVDGIYKVQNRRIAMRHRLSMGTIVSEPVLKIKYIGGGFIGTVEESFVSRLKMGDVFWFAGRSLQLERIKDLTVLVRKSKSNKGVVPRWAGGRLPLSTQLSKLIRQTLEEAAEGKNNEPEMKRVEPILQLQSRWSAIPDSNTLLVEHFLSREGYHLLFYPFEGRFVHELLAALVAYRISRLIPITFSMAMNDYGFELLSDTPIPYQEALEQDLFSTKNLMEDVQQSVNSTEMAKRRFREIAAIAGLVFQGYPGKPITSKHLHASSQIIFDVFGEYEPNNLLMLQARQEAMSQLQEQDRFTETINRINRQRLRLELPPRPTPFAFPIMVDRLRERLTSEKLLDRISRMQLSLEEYASKEGFLK
ncbi:ligase-associated DNA damage response DEXH box helicase [Nafulsella turpanensis]|uniref:ligase-associated DNA damage response DEXH box helicase n=1 Tax=Nafulsella turpanensis TaxID=1265690 RepID=UPI0003450F59|nr:ligase-associated DNA damage response DEXH box helicase [Nafulsella turpanensis]